MTARDIQHGLFAQYGGSSALMIPNYTPNHWFECDLFRVTKAGYAEEFEIKLSVSDFRADAKKGPDEREKQRMASYPEERQKKLGFEFRSKHERLADGDVRGPCRFWFAMPEEIAGAVVIPEWAGLIVFRKRYSHGRIQKPAPKLHKSKLDSKIIDHARGVFYFRYWNIRRGIKESEAVPSASIPSHSD